MASGQEDRWVQTAHLPSPEHVILKILFSFSQEMVADCLCAPAKPSGNKEPQDPAIPMKEQGRQKPISATQPIGACGDLSDRGTRANPSLSPGGQEAEGHKEW